MIVDAPVRESWHELNQRHLTIAVWEVRAALERHVARTADATRTDATRADATRADATRADATRTVETAPAGLPSTPSDGASPSARPMALDEVSALFNLSTFERALLVLCAGAELDSRLAALCAAAHGDAQRTYATLSLALAVLPGAHWSALTPGSPLRYWRLIEVGSGYALTTSPLRIDERILHHLAGLPQLDQRLVGVVEPLREARDLAPSHVLIADRVVAYWSQGGTEPPPIIQLRGDGLVDKRAIAASACASLGLRPWVLSAESIPTNPAETEQLIRIWRRETILSECALLVDCEDLDTPDPARAAAVTRVIENTPGPVMVAVREPRRSGRRATVTLDVTKPTTSEQRAAWRSALGPTGDRVNGQVELLVSQFNLSTHRIGAAVKACAPLGSDAAAIGRALWDACRTEARPRLDDLSQRIDSAARWDDLVLPEAQRDILRDIAAHVRQRATVYEEWGFARQGGRGLGISALFTGASGTGKTMAAEVLAGVLRLDLYRIDLSSVVSKYIGETEKNLRRIFDAAEEAGAILLFDEADALFGKRSEVKDSHDRYANIEVSYLLQRMECYRGLAILTTNLKSALDPAFLRRIRFVVQFPFPDAAHRAEIWRRVFPRETPTRDLTVERLAQLNVSGGNIRNIATAAAFVAADAGEPVQMAHLLRAARSEYAKLEKPMTPTEIEGWI